MRGDEPSHRAQTPREIRGSLPSSVGDDRANGVTVALGAGGALSVTFVAPYSGPTTQVIFDVTGYYMP